MRKIQRLTIVSLVASGLFWWSGCEPSASSVPDSLQQLAEMAQWTAPEFDDSFWQYWGDGQAEVSSYDLTALRYGEPRKGTAVAIFVTETFSNSLRVKADPDKHPPSDEVPVMKLNLVEDFPTGIYDYNLMTSSFISLQPVNGRPPGSPMKVSFTAQEWCGHVYSHMLFDEDSIRHVIHSYFDGEADQRGTLDYPPNAIAEDALWFWARGFGGPQLEPGESLSVPLLISLEKARTTHKPNDWQRAELSRSTDTEEIDVPAGTFTVERRTARIPESGRTWTFFVEKDRPRRLIQWETSDGGSAQMVGSERLQYWKMNGSEYEDAVKKIGLHPRPPRTP